ncbi:hypothetical protein CEXT_476931 [Caerostris extrusa]|uniref:Uncharacterized protein n=1 Tax=Caerostris extrusa TaxID=172846 RepID=A0AAV4X6L4_CAEEX|nr:hypothetical protein CEXT_476931 [Caerostris extrusa]
MYDRSGKRNQQHQDDRFGDKGDMTATYQANFVPTLSWELRKKQYNTTWFLAKHRSADEAKGLIADVFCSSISSISAQSQLGWTSRTRVEEEMQTYAHQ